MNPFPAFSIFHYAGRIPLIADGEIAGLRGAEDRARMTQRRSKRHKLVMGQRVNLSEGAYAGMSGVVEDGDGKFALVAFAGGIRMKIGTWLLSADDVCGNDPGNGSAARAA